jgi:putative addiction module component (TIGR02574 family)
VLVTSTAKKLLDEALALSEQEREELVAALSDSLAPESVTLSPGWTSEVGNRIAQIESGEVKPVPWTEVEARIERSLGRK